MNFMINSIIIEFFIKRMILNLNLSRGVLPENLRRGRTLWSTSELALCSVSLLKNIQRKFCYFFDCSTGDLLFRKFCYFFGL